MRSIKFENIVESILIFATVVCIGSAVQNSDDAQEKNIPIAEKIEAEYRA